MSEPPHPDDALDLEAEIDIHNGLVTARQDPPVLDPDTEAQLRARLNPPTP